MATPAALENMQSNWRAAGPIRGGDEGEEEGEAGGAGGAWGACDAWSGRDEKASAATAVGDAAAADVLDSASVPACTIRMRRLMITTDAGAVGANGGPTRCWQQREAASEAVHGTRVEGAE